jgi:endonuclease/exonuclease/phosphatase family metal-dependent hydrolase
MNLSSCPGPAGRAPYAALAAWCLLAAALETACSLAPAAEPERRLSAAFWNVHALFDGSDDGAEYAEFRAAAGWCDAYYRERLGRFAAAAAALGEGGPDLWALAEIEDAGVLADLVSGPLAGLGYRWTAAAAADGPITVGVLSRYPLSGVRSLQAAIAGAAPLRPVLEVRVEAEGRPLALFVCHWKSKSGDAADGGEGLRRASAAVLAARIAELAVSEPELACLVLGDLNEGVDEFVRRGAARPTALLPDAPDAARAWSAAVPAPAAPALVVSARRPPAALAFAEPAVALFTPWPGAPWEGSYWYGGAWETIDHVLAGAALFDGAGWEYSGFRVGAGEPFADAEGRPRAYDPRRRVGLSDHLPVVAELVLAKEAPASAAPR